MVCGNSTSVCGWAQLMDANIASAAFTMYNEAFAGWIVLILFVVYQGLLLMKTRNLTIAWVTGIFFTSLYITSQVFIPSISVQLIFVILAFELAGIFYLWLFVD